MPVLLGFETQFVFQITDLTRICTQVKDSSFQISHHESCKVQGGDGFAFVLHGDPRGRGALGSDGGELGYGGIKNSIAIEFDTWHNANTSDLWVDHISVHAGAGMEGINSASAEEARLLIPVPYDLADGAMHEVKIIYFPFVNHKYLYAMSGSENLLPHLKDNAENRRVGSLVVWMDDGIKSDRAIIAIPVNLSLLLNLPQGTATVGFTSSTGLHWEKHDILGWYFCENPPCVRLSPFEFDYHLQSLKYTGPTVVHGDETLPDHTVPDTTPWAAPKQHFASDRLDGLTAVYTIDEVIDP